MMSVKERFVGVGHGKQQFAPSTLGPSKYKDPADTTVFKKTPKEKLEAAEVRKRHKRDLVKYYGKGNVGKNLNISSQ